MVISPFFFRSLGALSLLLLALCFRPYYLMLSAYSFLLESVLWIVTRYAADSDAFVFVPTFSLDYFLVLSAFVVLLLESPL